MRQIGITWDQPRYCLDCTASHETLLECRSRKVVCAQCGADDTDVWWAKAVAQSTIRWTVDGVWNAMIPPISTRGGGSLVLNEPDVKGVCDDCAPEMKDAWRVLREYPMRPRKVAVW